MSRAELQLLRKLDRERLGLLKRTVAHGSTEDEFAMFVSTCERLGLDPFTHQIHCVIPRDRDGGRKGPMQIQIGIDGYRLLADRSGRYAGQVGPWWAGEDGGWVELWDAAVPPRAAKVGVCRLGFSQPLYAVAHWRSSAELDRDGRPRGRWARAPEQMLAIAAERVALRRAFPAELAAAEVYVRDRAAHTASETFEDELELEPSSVEEEVREPAPEDPSKGPRPHHPVRDCPHLDEQGRSTWQPAPRPGFVLCRRCRSAKPVGEVEAEVGAS